MILSKEQIDRYLRHIIMPEISGKGQKELLESSVLIYSENTRELMPIVLYLSAMGIGKIFCNLKHNSGYESLFCNALDLNNDISIEIVNEHFSIDSVDVRILIGSIDFIKDNIISNIFVPTIISMSNQWKGTFQTFTDANELNEFIEFINRQQYSIEINPLIISFSSALCSVECVKLLLNIGRNHEDLLLFDLLLMEFCTFNKNQYETAFVEFSIKNDVRLNEDEILKKLEFSKILIVGAGGLGSPAAFGLVLSGVGTIGLLDLDKVEVSNLNRQILHSVSRIGMTKVESSKYFISKINQNININTHVVNLNNDNAENIIKEYDLVVSAVDNIKTRYIINDTCYLMKKPVVEAGVLRFDGTNTTIIPDEGHCYRCLYPNVNTGMSCSEAGILGSVPGVMGFIEAIEAVKIIANIGISLKNKILLFDGLEMEFNVVNLEKNPDCPLCSPKQKQIKSS